MLYGTICLLYFLYIILLFKHINGFFYFSSIEQLYGTLCNGIDLALINTCKHVGILIHVL